MAYEAYWEKDRFTLTDPSGALLDVMVEGMCPTVDEGLGRELIKEIERSMVRERARLAVLKGDGGRGELEVEEVHHLRELRELFPEVPLQILVRILPKVGWTGEPLPWNRHERRRVRKAREVVVHLFSGDTKKFWQRELESEGRAVLCVDTVIDPGMNILRLPVGDRRWRHTTSLTRRPTLQDDEPVAVSTTWTSTPSREGRTREVWPAEFGSSSEAAGGG